MTANTTFHDQYFNNFKLAGAFAWDLKQKTGYSALCKRHSKGFIVRVPTQYLASATTLLGAAARQVLGRPAEVGVFGASVLFLLSASNSGMADPLVLDAVRRSNSALADASPESISAYFAELAPEQLAGALNNIKGIYHELAFVAAENADADLWVAEVYAATNHAGGDVLLTHSLTGETVELQLKATDSVSYVMEHMARYPDIDVAATSEVANTSDAIADSGFSNADLNANVDATLESLNPDELASVIGEAESILGYSVTASALTALIAGGYALYQGEKLEDVGAQVKQKVTRSLKLSASIGVAAAIFM